MRPFLKFYKWFGLVLLALAAVLLVAGTILTALSWYRDPAPALVRVEARPSGPVFIGAPVEYRLIVSCPYYRLPTRPFQVTLPDGVQSVNIEKSWPAGFGWFAWRWKCGIVVQAYELGKKDGGKMTVAFSAGRRPAADAVSAVLPALEVKPRLGAAGAPLTVSPELPASLIRDQLRWWHFVALAVLVAAIVYAIMTLFRRRELLREAAPPPPPWELAANAMRHLERRLPLAAELFFVELTDILRAYCEARFDVRASEATTPEFLGSIRANPLLTGEQRSALADFLAAADEVKFAKGDATQEQLLAALRTARQFVADTVPAPVVTIGKTGKRRGPQFEPEPDDSAVVQEPGQAGEDDRHKGR